MLFKTNKYILLLALNLVLFAGYTHAQDSDSTRKVKIVAPNDSLNHNKADSVAQTLAKLFGKDTTASLPPDSLATNTKDEGLTEPVSYESNDSIRFNVNTKKIAMYGSGTVTYEDITLKSDQIELDMDKKVVTARGRKDTMDNIHGRPNFTQGSEEFDADTLKFNFDTKKGLAYGIYTKQNEGYLHSEKTKIMPNKNVNIKGGKFTTCDLHEPHFYVKMTKAKVIPDDKIVSGPAYLVIEDVPLPLVVPFGMFPNKKGRTSGIIIPKPGEEREKGFYFREGGVYLGFSDYVDLKILGDVYTLGSWRLSGRSTYVKRYKFRGDVSAEYASLVIDEKKQPRTFNFNWTHNQDRKANPNGTFSANVNYGSVGHNRQNARDEEQYLNNTTRSSISYDRNFQNTPMSARMTATHSQNSLDSIINLTLPTLSFNVSSFAPFKHKKSVGKEKPYEKIRFEYSFEAVNKVSTKLDSTFYTTKTLDKVRQGAKNYARVSLPFKLLKYFTMTPSADYTERWYIEKSTKQWDPTLITRTQRTTVLGGVRTDTTKGFYRVWDYSLSTSLSTTIYGMYNMRNKVVRAFRHKLTPSVSYTFKPNFGQRGYGYYGEYQSDSTGTTRKYTYYDNAIYGVPQSYKVSSIGLNLGNSLEMKVRNRADTNTLTKKITLLDNVSAGTAYNMAADSLKWDYINFSASTTILRRVNIRYSSRYDMYALARGIKQNSKQLVRTNTFMWQRYNRYYRIEDSRWDLSTSLSLGPMKKKEVGKKDNNQQKNTSPQYSSFKIPWNVNLSYSIAIPRKYFYDENNRIDSVGSQVIQTMGISSSVSITKNWAIRVSTGWDFEAQKITYTKIDFLRDLHCWDMSFMWIPWGGMQRYEFLVKVKASMFQDLKMEKRKTYGNTF